MALPDAALSGWAERATDMRMALARTGEPPQSTDVAPAEDAEVLSALARGDAATFRTVMARHLPSVLAIARRMLRSDAEADDVSQETLLRLWRNAGSLELGPGGLKPWLRRVVSNLCIDRIRAGRHLVVVDEVPDQAEPPPQFDEIAAKQLSARVDQALKGLPERQRLALTLFHFEGMSQNEVGAMLGVSGEAVESLLARARRSLKVTLKAEWTDMLCDGGRSP